MEAFAMNKLFRQPAMPRTAIVNQSSIHNRQSTMNRQSSIVNRQLVLLLFVVPFVFAASLEKALDKSVSFELSNKPLLDAAAQLADQNKINILIDPNLIKDK